MSDVLFIILFQASCTSSAVISQHSTRDYSSVHTQQPAGPIREYKIDPYILLEDELKYVFEDIRQVCDFDKFEHPAHSFCLLTVIPNVDIHESKWDHTDFFRPLYLCQCFLVGLRNRRNFGEKIGRFQRVDTRRTFSKIRESRLLLGWKLHVDLKLDPPDLNYLAKTGVFLSSFVLHVNLAIRVWRQ